MTFDPETLTTAGFPLISFETLDVGTTFRSDDRVIRPQDVEAYAFAIDDHDPWFFGPGPFDKPIVHPTLLANQALFLRHNRFVVPAGLHARMSFEFLAPIPLGVRARTVGEVVDKYVRRDKPYMVTEFRTFDDGSGSNGGGRGGAEHPLIRGRFVQMLFHRETAPPSGSAAPPEPPRPNLDPAIASVEGRGGTLSVGERLSALERTIRQRQIDTYSGVRPGSIHTDPEWAKAKGFSSTIAQGMMTTAHVSNLMTTNVGAGFIQGGTMDVRFLHPVFCDDTLRITGTVRGFSRSAGQPDDQPDAVRVHVDVKAENQSGRATMAGSATALIPA